MTKTDTNVLYDLLVVGAGPAGLMGAIAASQKKLTVCVLEKNNNAGRKLLIAGSTQCNITHAGGIEDFLPHYGDHGRFVKPALYAFDNDALVDFFATRGLDVTETETGKIFPASMRGSDVLAILLDELRLQGVRMFYGGAVSAVVREDSFFTVKTEKDLFTARNILITTGGMSYPKTGSCGDGYALAKKLGHSIVSPAPALAPVIVKDYRFASCSGISIRDAKIVLLRGGRKCGAAKGDVLFTHKGLSGPGVLDFSRNVEAGDELRVSLAGFDNEEECERSLMEAVLANAKKNTGNLLAAFGVPARLAEALLDFCGVPANISVSRLDRKMRRRIVQELCGLSFAVEALGGFSEAMVTRGGVALDGVNAKTMESRIVKGLFFAGEVLDVDGDTGGYNLQFAFSSGRLAGNSVEQ